MGKSTISTGPFSIFDVCLPEGNIAIENGDLYWISLIENGDFPVRYERVYQRVCHLIQMVTGGYWRMAIGLLF